MKRETIVAVWLCAVGVSLVVLTLVSLLTIPSEPVRSAAAPAATEELATGEHTLSGPYTHGNLSVYLVLGRSESDAEFITLDEGLESGVVSVTEADDAEVNRVIVDNRSEHPLFLQEGDRLLGGNQDRMVYASLVVPPRSGSVDLPAFCIEASRWGAGTTGTHFTGSGSGALSPKSVRFAGKVGASQQAVWRNVASKKGAYADELGSANTNSSLNEAMDSAAARAAARDYEADLGSLAAEHIDAIGVVFVVNQQIEEADIYPTHTLFTKVYPRLLQSFAIDAAAGSMGLRDPVTAGAVQRFLAGSGTPVRDEALNAHNRLTITDLGGRLRMRTHYRDELVHDQYMKAEAA